MTLLSRGRRGGDCKKIESGEQEVLRALLDTLTGVECILTMGHNIEQRALRPKYVLRDVDEGETYVDEMLQTEKFVSTITGIRQIHEEELRFFASAWPRTGSIRKNAVESDAASSAAIRKIFELLKEWRLEGSVIDKMERVILSQIEWFDAMNAMLHASADNLGATVTELRANLENQDRIRQMGQRPLQPDPG